MKTSDGLKIRQIDEGRNGWHQVVRYWQMQISGMSLMIPPEDFETQEFDLGELRGRLRPGSVAGLQMMAWYREVGWPLPALTCSADWQTEVRNADILYEVEGGW